jgi:hypothetical protein
MFEGFFTSVQNDKKKRGKCNTSTSQTYYLLSGDDSLLNFR